VREISRLKPDDIHAGYDYLVLRTRKAKNSDEVERTIPVNKVLRQVLKEFPRDVEYIFTNPRTKTKFDYRDKFLPNLCEKAGVKRFTFHCLCGISLLRLWLTQVYRFAHNTKNTGSPKAHNNGYLSKEHKGKL